MKYQINDKRFCPKCDKQISNKNKSGFCNKHRDRTGVNNSFYSKHHTQETRENLKIQCREASKKLWLIPEYRKTVIKNISKPRREGFKKEQSIRITKWYKDNPEQRSIRSVTMKETWATGKITKNGYSCNKSKKEKEFYLYINSIVEGAEACRTINGSDGKWYFPDIIIQKDGIIIEYFGDYWHANPKFYKSTDIVAHGALASTVWANDEKRVRQLEELGYQVICVWQDDYKNNKEILKAYLDWESCAF